MNKEEKIKAKLKAFLLDNCLAISWTIKINSQENCFEKTVWMWKWNWALVLNLWDCKIKKYQAVDLELTNLDEIYSKLKNIFIT